MVQITPGALNSGKSSNQALSTPAIKCLPRDSKNAVWKMPLQQRYRTDQFVVCVWARKLEGRRRRARKRSRCASKTESCAACEPCLAEKQLFAHYSPLAVPALPGQWRPIFSWRAFDPAATMPNTKQVATTFLILLAQQHPSSGGGAIWIRAELGVFRDFIYLRPSPRVSALIKLFYMNHHVWCGAYMSGPVGRQERALTQSPKRTERLRLS